MFKKILIANRGEIACRIIDSCRRLGVRTVAVYSEADAAARHVRMADEAFCVGPAASNESYLRGERIIEVAQRAGAEAIHPGYGFLSENEAFAQACHDAGVIFIGPPVEAIRAMGAKSAAKRLMDEAGVPLVPGYHGDDQDAERLQAEADRIGYPAIIKASAGGGGKGMRVVRSVEAFAEELASCRREARASFGDDHVLIEKYLERPRHIEIQIFADQNGQTISLFERDCSAQRRHQKVVEEAPAPGIDEAQRARMGEAACNAARAVDYVGAGTVEFIADDSGAFYFMEMNTRLQVEHPVTEMITGLDLVEWQLRVASGESLPREPSALAIDGHAIEVRLYAEDPARGFLPSIGRLAHFVAPPASAHVRLDSGVEQGDEITPHYDPMIAKLIVWDSDRAAAVERMLSALADLQIVGVRHNGDFLGRLIDHEVFRAGKVDTGLIEREMETLAPASPDVPAVFFHAAALALLADERARVATGASPWAAADGWRLNARQHRTLVFTAGEQEREIRVAYADDALHVDGERAALEPREGARYRLIHGASQQDVSLVGTAAARHVFAAGAHHEIAWRDPLASAGAVDDPQAELTAPMPGTIVAINHDAGAHVEAGTPILVMEAMKMELTIKAPASGTVVRYDCAVGDQVGEGAELFEFEADAPDTSA